VPHQSTDQITSECDRIDRECDCLLDAAIHADVSIDRLHFTAGQMQAQMEMLGAAQTKVAQQRRILSNKLFWRRMHPVALMNRLGDALSNPWRPAPRVNAPQSYRTLRGFK